MTIYDYFDVFGKTNIILEHVFSLLSTFATCLFLCIILGQWQTLVWEHWLIMIYVLLCGHGIGLSLYVGSVLDVNLSYVEYRFIDRTTQSSHILHVLWMCYLMDGSVYLA